MALYDRLVNVTRAAWRRVRPEIAEHIERLWAEPELPLMETRAAEALAAWMERHGFDVERAACGIPTAFAARFAELVGESPIAYLTRWRMHVASEWLAEDGRTVSQIARQLGYGSEAAFSRAFKRVIGATPSSVTAGDAGGPAGGSG